MSRPRAMPPKVSRRKVDQAFHNLTDRAVELDRANHLLVGALRLWRRIAYVGIPAGLVIGGLVGWLVF